MPNGSSSSRRESLRPSTANFVEYFLSESGTSSKAPYEVLGLAGKLTGGALQSSLGTAGRPGPVRCTYGTVVDVPRGWSPDEAEVLVVPGGGYKDRNGPGVHRVNADQGFLRR